VLQYPAVLQENIYNIDKIGIMFFKLNFVKVFVNRDYKRGYRGVCIKRTTVTAIEYVSTDDKYLNLMIIWLITIHRANWIMHFIFR